VLTFSFGIVKWTPTDLENLQKATTAFWQTHTDAWNYKMTFHD
jgi:hypothetical protein